MATVTMNYHNVDIPPPLPPSRPPKAKDQATLPRRPLPEVPSGAISKQNQSGRPLPNLPTGESHQPQNSHGRRFSLPQNQQTPQAGGVKGKLTRQMSVDNKPSSMRPGHTSVDAKRQQNITSPVPPKLPPRKQSVEISPHSHQINNGGHRSTSPPVPPRLNSLDNLRKENGNSNTHEYETRFHFHTLDDLPEPEEFSNIKKTYLSRTENNNTKEQRRKRAVEELPAY